MANSNVIALSKYFEAVTKDLKSDQAEKGIKASGQSAASLRFTASETQGTLYGSNTFYWQIFGRKPGKYAPPDAILQWIKSKGITPDNPKTSLKSLAFLINRKIATKGTNIFTGKSKGLSFDEIIGGKNLDTLTEELAERKVKEITTFLKSELTKK